MANREEKGKDFYAVLGLNKECSASDLRNAYKKLALRWHPDRCSASGSSKFVEEAKKKFQAIQQAYSVLSDENKRFMYDIGVYDSDDDENGMGDFLNEMAVMMSETKPNENGGETFEELQQLFEDMFQGDINETFTYNSSYCCERSSSSSSSSSSYASYSGSSSNSNNKCDSSDINNGDTSANGSSNFVARHQSFCIGTSGSSSGYEGGEGSKRRGSRRSKR